MRKFVLIVAALILIGTFLPLNAYEVALPDCCNCTYWPARTFSFYAGVGWRQDCFNWEVSNSRKLFPEFPDKTYTRVKWHHLRMIQVSAGARYVCRRYVFRLKGDYGHIYHGHNKDTDLIKVDTPFKADKEVVLSKAKSDADRGYVWHVSPGVGYQLTSNGGRTIVTPMVGYSYHVQGLRIRNGNQKFHKFKPERIGPFPRLDSSYNSRWYGGWVGLDFETRVECNAWLFGSLEYHWMRFRATGHWNLRKDITDFRHKANAQGYIANLGFSWECIPNLTFGFMGDYKFFRTTVGEENSKIRRFPPLVGNLTGKKKIRIKGTLRRAHWHAISVSAFIGYRF